MKDNKICRTLYLWTVCLMFVVAGGLSSCNFLSIEDYIDNDLAIDSIFTQKRYIEAYMWGAASYFPDEGRLYGNPYYPGPMATDEAFSERNLNEFQGMAFVTGARDATNLGSLNQWTYCYQIIRQCNTIIDRIDEVRDWTFSERARIIAYTRFFRAYAYYLILMNHGPVVLLGDEVIKNNEDIAFYDRPRDLYDDCVEYICTEFEEASQNMQSTFSSIADFGQPTRGAALALVARLRLQHASDLFNGGNSARMYFNSWRRKTDDQHYIQQDFDPRRWAVAAAAAKRVIDMRNDGGAKMYELHTVNADNFTPQLSDKTPDQNYHTLDFPDGAINIDPYHSCADMFNGETPMYVNKEFIWARSSSATLEYTRHSFPYVYGGINGLSVTQKIVDAYEMADGRPINNPSSKDPDEKFSYTEEGTKNSYSENWYSGYRLYPDVHNMYVNREARFYASIGFSECYWSMTSTTDLQLKGQVVKYYANEPNGRNQTSADGYPRTGYVIKKYIHPADAWTGNASKRISKPYAMIRYAEILLIYAEALNKLGNESFTIDIEGTPQTFYRNTEEIKRAYNQVRYRAGLPGLTDNDLTDPDFVMAKIKRERMVEFLHEGQRYFDVRRWGDYETSESEPITGMNVSSPKDGYYQRVLVQSSRVTQRVVNRKMIFVPIPNAEIKRLPSFDQNPGW